jgi:hypothetical protein
MDDPSTSRQPPTEVEYLKLQAQIREMELKHQIENQQMEIDFMKRLLHQQQLIGPEMHVEIDVQQDDIEPQLDQQDDYLNPFHPEFYSNLDSFCDSALKEDITLNDDPSLKLLQVIVNKAIEEKECETKRIKTIVNIPKMLPQQIQLVKEEIQSLQIALSLSQKDEQALEQLLQQTHKLSRLKLQQDCQPFIKPAPLDDDPIITQFQPVNGQWELNGENIKRIDPKSGETILHNYCRHINSTPLPIFQYLIETKGCGITIQSKYRGTPIHVAFLYFNPNEGGDINTLKYLINLKGFDVNIKDNIGRTILHSACENINGPSLLIFQYLIEIKGGDITIQSKYCDTPIHLAFCCFDPNKGGDINTLKYLINLKGLDVNMKDYNNRTILHYACRQINKLPLDIIKYLIENKGSEIDCLDRDGNTPLRLLMTYLSVKLDCKGSQTAEYLIEKGIPINHKNLYKLTVLDAFSQHKSTHPLTYGVLIKNGAKLGKDC